MLVIEFSKADHSGGIRHSIQFGSDLVCFTWKRLVIAGFLLVYNVCLFTGKRDGALLLWFYNMRVSFHRECNAGCLCFALEACTAFSGSRYVLHASLLLFNNTFVLPGAACGHPFCLTIWFHNTFVLPGIQWASYCIRFTWKRFPSIFISPGIQWFPVLHSFHMETQCMLPFCFTIHLYHRKRNAGFLQEAIQRLPIHRFTVLLLKLPGFHRDAPTGFSIDIRVG